MIMLKRLFFCIKLQILPNICKMNSFCWTFVNLISSCFRFRVILFFFYSFNLISSYLVLYCCNLIINSLTMDCELLHPSRLDFAFCGRRQTVPFYIQCGNKLNKNCLLINKPLHLFEMHGTFLPLFNPNLDFLQAVISYKIWSLSVA